MQLFLQQMFAYDVAGFFQKLWLPIVANLTVGVSLGLPLFVYMRQAKLDQAA